MTAAVAVVDTGTRKAPRYATNKTYHTSLGSVPTPLSDDVSAVTSSSSVLAATSHTKVATGPSPGTMIQAPAPTVWHEGPPAPSPQAPRGADPENTQAHVQVHRDKNFDHFMFATDATSADEIDIAATVAAREDKGTAAPAPEQQQEGGELLDDRWGRMCPNFHDLLPDMGDEPTAPAK